MCLLVIHTDVSDSTFQTVVSDRPKKSFGRFILHLDSSGHIYQIL